MSTRLKPLRGTLIATVLDKTGQRRGAWRHAGSAYAGFGVVWCGVVYKPLSVSSGMGLLGFTKQTGFKAAALITELVNSLSL